MYLFFASKGAVILNGKTVSLILDPGYQMETLTRSINGNFNIIEIHPSGSVVVILYHTTYRNINSKLSKNLPCNVYLATSAIHKDQIRKNGKAVVFALGFMGKTPCKHLFHAGVIVRSLHPFDLEFSVIAALRLALFVNHHGTNGLKPTDIGYIVGLHTHNILKPQPVLNLLHSPDRTPFFALDPFSVFGKNHPGVFLGKLHQFLLCSLFRYTDVNPLFTPCRQPVFNNFPIFYLCLHHDFRRNKRRSCIKLLQKA